jgi:type II secretory pathway pseudopilin PulG
MEQYINNKGQAFIELLLTITIIAIIFGSSLFSVQLVYKSIEISKQKLEAKYLLQQQIESLYAVQNQSWSNLVAGEYYLQYNPTNATPHIVQGWELVPGSETYNEYTVDVVIAPAYRSNSNTFTTDTTQPIDTNSMEVTANVSFNSFGENFSYSETEYLTNWQSF